jgi:dye decolorizing peroxidase
VSRPPLPGSPDPDGTGRRAVLLSGLGGLGAAALAVAQSHSAPPAAVTPEDPAASADRDPYGRRPFRGARQSGIIDHPQPYAAFVAFDLVPDGGPDEVQRLLTVLTDDIERLMDGRGPLTDMERELAEVTGELTVTVGVGPGLVTAVGAVAPSWLAPLPSFSIDRLDPQWGASDLVLQICANSPTTVAHAQRHLTTALRPLTRPRWVQRGFREPFEGPGLPMRNLLGQVDGTVQPAVDGPDDGLLFVSEGPAWLRDGSALVLRRIRMNRDTWDAVDRVDRENAIGRRLDTGAPVTAPPGADAGVAPDLGAVDDLGFHVIDDASHLRRAHARAPHERFLRRPYNYDDSTGAADDAGLLFAAYMADPVRQFVPVQRRLAEQDLLNIWTTPVGSAVWAVLPGARAGELLGAALLV